MTKQLIVQVREITYTNGKHEIIAVTPRQMAGKNRTKGFKKSVLTNKVHALLTIQIKTK